MGLHDDSQGEFDLRGLDDEELRRLLVQLIGQIRTDAAAAGVFAALYGRRVPLDALQAAKQALEAWADAGARLQLPGAKTRRIYVMEVDDIIRRVAADLAAQS